MGFLMSNNAIDVCDDVLYGENVFACLSVEMQWMERVVTVCGQWRCNNEVKLRGSPTLEVTIVRTISRGKRSTGAVAAPALAVPER